MEVKILQDYRNLITGDTFKFNKDTNIIVGRNGSGKSSLLNLIRSHWEGHYMCRESDYKKYVQIEGLEEFGFFMDFNSESDGYNGKSFCDMDYLLADGSFGIKMMSRSTGQVQLATIEKIMRDAAKKWTESGKKGLIVLDEIDRGFDLYTQNALFSLMGVLASFARLIIVSHCQPFLENYPIVYDLGSRKHLDWSDYLKNQVTKGIL